MRVGHNFFMFFLLVHLISVVIPGGAFHITILGKLMCGHFLNVNANLQVKQGQTPVIMKNLIYSNNQQNNLILDADIEDVSGCYLEITPLNDSTLFNSNCNKSIIKNIPLKNLSAALAIIDCGICDFATGLCEIVNSEEETSAEYDIVSEASNSIEYVTAKRKKRSNSLSSSNMSKSKSLEITNKKRKRNEHSGSLGSTYTELESRSIESHRKVGQKSYDLGSESSTLKSLESKTRRKSSYSLGSEIDTSLSQENHKKHHHNSRTLNSDEWNTRLENTEGNERKERHRASNSLGSSNDVSGMKTHKGNHKSTSLGSNENYSTNLESSNKYAFSNSLGSSESAERVNRRKDYTSNSLELEENEQENDKKHHRSSKSLGSDGSGLQTDENRHTHHHRSTSLGTEEDISEVRQKDHRDSNSLGSREDRHQDSKSLGFTEDTSHIDHQFWKSHSLSSSEATSRNISVEPKSFSLGSTETLFNSETIDSEEEPVFLSMEENRKLERITNYNSKSLGSEGDEYEWSDQSTIERPLSLESFKLQIGQYFGGKDDILDDEDLIRVHDMDVKRVFGNLFY